MGSVGVVGAGAAGLAAAHRLMPAGPHGHGLRGVGRAGGSGRHRTAGRFPGRARPQFDGGSERRRRPAPARALGLEERRVDASRPPGSATSSGTAGRSRCRSRRPPFLTSSFFSAKAKLTLLTEPLASPAPAGDESIAGFVRRPVRAGVPRLRRRSVRERGLRRRSRGALDTPRVAAESMRWSASTGRC